MYNLFEGTDIAPPLYILGWLYQYDCAGAAPGSWRQHSSLHFIACFTVQSVSQSPSPVYTYIPKLLHLTWQFHSLNSMHVYWSEQPRAIWRLTSLFYQMPFLFEYCQWFIIGPHICLCKIYGKCDILDKSLVIFRVPSCRRPHFYVSQH